MSDPFDLAKRSEIMARVRSKNTSPELRLRKALFSQGLRYRLHNSILPGKPDIVLKKYRAVIFVNGCFWHWHGCRRSRMPKTNEQYWLVKIARNQSRDHSNLAALTSLGWRILVVWECALGVRNARLAAELAKQWIVSTTEPNLMCIEPVLDQESGKESLQLRRISQ